MIKCILLSANMQGSDARFTISRAFNVWTW